MTKMDDVVDNLSGEVNPTAATWGTFNLRIDAILKNPKIGAGEGFARLTQVAEQMAKERGLPQLRLNLGWLWILL